MTQSFIPISRPSIGLREQELVLDAVRSGWVSSIGQYVDAFEEQFAKYCGTRRALTVSSGTAALHLALETLGVKPGDEVIIPDLTFVAVANAVAYTGATVVLADIDPETLCIDPGSVQQKITPKTRAIIPVHLYGHPAEMDTLIAFAEAQGIAVIEDAAEAHGAEYRGRRAGSLGRCGVFSFYGNKVMTTGEGGMLVTDDDAFWQRAKRLRDHAMSSERRYFHSERGFNYRMTNLQAALGVAQLERLDELVSRRAEIMDWYRDELRLSDQVRINRSSNWVKNAFWLVCLEVERFTTRDRDAFMLELKARGIDSRPYFCTMSSLPMYQQKQQPVAARKSEIGLNLPSFHDLTRSEVQRIARDVNDILRKIGTT